MTFNGMQRVALLVAQALPPLLPQLGPPRTFTAADEQELRDRLFFTPFDELLLAVVARSVGETAIFRDRPGAGEARDHWTNLEQDLRRRHVFDANQLTDAFARAEALRPGDVRNEASRADYLSRLGATSEAAAAGQRILSRKPTYFEGYRFMADAAKERGDSAGARQLYRQALDLYRLIPDAHKNLGDLARESGDLQQARDAYTRAFSLDAGNVGAALALAEIQANTPDRTAAQLTLETARDHNPHDAAIHRALARLHAVEGDKQAARDAYAQALQLDPAMSPRELLRFASENFGPLEQKTIFAAYEDRFGQEADLYNNFAWLLPTAPAAEVRDPAAALRLAQRAVELSDEPNAYFHGTLAAAAAAGGDFAEAQANLQQAKELAAADAVLAGQLSEMEAAFSAGRAYIEAAASSSQ